MPTATLVLDATESIQNNIPTTETTNFQQTTDNNVTSIQQVKERPVGCDSYSSDSSSNSDDFSAGVIAGIVVGVIGGIFFCCCCLFILGKLCRQNSE